MKDELWTIEEVAERWKVTQRVVREMLCRGEICGFKIRNTWRVYLSEIMRYEQDQDPLTKKNSNCRVAPMPKPVVVRIT